MKKLIITLLLLTIVVSGKDLKGFKDISWGENQKSAYEKVKKHYNGCEYEKEYITCVNKVFLGKNAEFILFRFKEGFGFYELVVVFEEYHKNIIIDKHKEVKALISKKHGKPDDDYYYFNSPYKEGDGLEAQAISLHKGEVSSFWNIESNNSICALEILPTLRLKYIVQSKGLIKKIVESNQQEALSDL